jgi:hypothetical protein
MICFLPTKAAIFKNLKKITVCRVKMNRDAKGKFYVFQEKLFLLQQNTIGNYTAQLPAVTYRRQLCLNLCKN